MDFKGVEAFQHKECWVPASWNILLYFSGWRVGSDEALAVNFAVDSELLEPDLLELKNRTVFQVFGALC